MHKNVWIKSRIWRVNLHEILAIAVVDRKPRGTAQKTEKTHMLLANT